MARHLVVAGSGQHARHLPRIGARRCGAALLAQLCRRHRLCLAERLQAGMVLTPVRPARYDTEVTQAKARQPPEQALAPGLGDQS